MLNISNVSKKFSKKIIFDKIDFSLLENGIYLVIGNNGDGKTTLFNIICDFINYKGKVKRNSDFSYVSQNSYLLEYLTISENYNLFNVDPRVLDKFGLSYLKDKYIKNLSLGEIKRVGVILGLKKKDRLVLLDEPFANLDSSNRNKILELIVNESKDKMIFVISHQKEFKDKKINSKVIIKDKKIKILKINKGSLNIDYKEKKESRFKYLVRYFKYSIRYMYKYYLVIFISLIFILALFVFRDIFTSLVNKDISYSLDYNKFYVSKCSDSLQERVNVNKCYSLEENDLNKINGVKLNLDIIILDLFKDKRFTSFDNDIKIKEGRLPKYYNEVIASEEYALGDVIKVNVDNSYSDARYDIYRDEIIFRVVGIYNKGKFIKDNNIYLDYDLVDKYLKDTKLINNNISLYDYYVNKDLGVYKYVYFGKYYESEYKFSNYKYEFYNNLVVVLDSVRELVKYLIIFVFCFSLYLQIKFILFKITKERESSIVFYLNGYFKKDVILRNCLIDIIYIFSLGLIFYLLSLEYIFLIFILASLIVLIGIESVYFRKHNIANLVRESYD